MTVVLLPIDNFLLPIVNFANFSTKTISVDLMMVPASASTLLLLESTLLLLETHKAKRDSETQR